MGQAHNDLGAGIAIEALADGTMMTGRVHDEDAILVRRGADYFAVGALCSHYHAPLADGLLVGETVRCPMHHACFSLRSGEALCAPALDPIPTWRVEVLLGKVYVREKLNPPTRPAGSPSVSSGKHPGSVVIVGGGAAGLAAADMLRRQRYSGPLTMISADDAAPYDRPNVSKDFLAGTAPEEWMPLRDSGYYAAQHIELMLKERVTSIDPARRLVALSNGRQIGYGALLLATGADPVRIPVPGASDAQMFYLRTLSDARAILAATATAKSAVVVGSSFIGLEVAASLRTRGLEVHVVAPEPIPLARVLGPDLGAYLHTLHQAHGVVFHLGNSVSRVDGRQVTLSGGSSLQADFIVLGVGVRPAVALAEQAGLAIDRGILVNQYLKTSAPDVFAAGDIARWPDPHSGGRIRVEHWVLAQRQGQVAARNMLGSAEPFAAVPFFWSQHYDVAINYAGHAENFDAVSIDGVLASHDCTVRYLQRGQVLAVATMSRDLESLQAECTLELQRTT